MLQEELIIKKLFDKYGKKLNVSLNKYLDISYDYNMEQLKNVIKYNCNLVKKVIVDIINEFEELNKADFVVLNGSYSRYTNLIGSDIDINIFYNNLYKDELFPIELKINYIISKILNYKGCDRVHSIMVYTELVSKDTLLFDGEYINYNNKFIPYYCRNNYEQLLYETINTSRDYNDLIKYFIKNDKNGVCLEEWKKNFTLIKKFNNRKNFEEDINNYNRSILLKEDFKEHLLIEKNSIISKIENYKFNDINEFVSIKNLKEKVKSIPMNLLYKSLAILLYREDKINMLSLNVDKQLENSIFKYLWIVLRIEIVFYKLSIDLSSHCDKLIEIQKINDVYNLLYNDNLLKNTEAIIEELLKNLIVNLKEVS